MKKITFLIFLMMTSLGFSQDPATGPAAPPARDSGDVVSFYNGITTPMGDDYTNIAGVTFDSFGGSTIVGDVTLGDGNTVIKYTGHNFSGIGSGNYDVSQMEMLHIDVYFDTAAGDFRIKLEDTSVAATEISVENNPAIDGWISYDIPLSSFTAPNLANLKWIVPVTTAANTTMLFDNVYFYRTPVDPATDASLSALDVDGSLITGFNSSILEYDFEVPTGTSVVPQITTATPTQAGASTSITQATGVPGVATVLVTATDMTTTQTYTVNIAEVGPSEAAPTPPVRAAGDVVAFYSDAYMETSNWGVIEPFGATTLTNIMVDGNNTYELVATPGGGYQYNYFASPGTSEDLSNMTHYHVDVWVDGSVAGGEVFTAQLLNYDGMDALESNNFYQAPITASGQWISVDVPISSFVNATGNTNYDNIRLLQIVLQGPEYGPVYFDNLYFYKSNDTCADATPIALDGNEITVSNVGATDSGVSASCDSGIISDVWYSFEGTATGEAYFTTTAPSLSVFTDCTGTTELACNPGDNVAVTGLTMGTTYYLRINDDGTARAPGTFTLTASEAALSTDDFSVTDFTAYPNPTTDKWNIKTNGQDITSVQVYDMLGKSVISLTPNKNAVEVDASALPGGLYFARISSDSGTKSIKLIKQ